MAWCPQEVIKLISLVRKRPCLYDVRHAEHNNREFVDISWMLIADEMGSKSAIDCKEKWSNLRGSYRRELKSMMRRSNIPGRKTQWFYFDMMSFMEPCINLNINQGMYLARKVDNCPYKLDDMDAPDSMQSFQHIKVEDNTDMFDNIDSFDNKLDSSKDSAILQTENGAKTAVTRLDCEDDSDASFSNKRNVSMALEDRQSKRIKMDPNMSFFYYVCENMKKLSDKEQSLFMTKVLSTLNDMLYPIDASEQRSSS